MEIRLATPNDIEDVFTLLKKYHVNSIKAEDKPDGFVTTNMSLQQMESLIVKERGVAVAEEKGSLAGFAMAGSWKFWSEWPLFEHMIRILPEHTLDGQVLSVQNSYQYGPVCVDKAVRGTGVFENIFRFSLCGMSKRFPIMVTFINKINPRSYIAHANKVHMLTVGTFQFNRNDYYLMACPTTSQKQDHATAKT